MYNSKVLFKIYFSFPVNLKRKLKWIAAVRLERQENNWMPSKASKICCLHFVEDDFYKSTKGYTLLHKTATPVCTVSIITKIILLLCKI
jgi:hypothetical protein